MDPLSPIAEKLLDLVISFLAQGSVFFSQAMFSYSDHPLNRSFGLPFDYNGTLDILIAPGQKGILIFWFEKSLLVSRNAGEIKAQVEQVQPYPNPPP